jgi:hypothetical protein
LSIIDDINYFIVICFEFDLWNCKTYIIKAENLNPNNRGIKVRLEYRDQKNESLVSNVENIREKFYGNYRALERT